MSLDKFKEREKEVEQIIVKTIRRFGKGKKEYNSDYKQRNFNDKVLLKKHVKLMKYPLELESRLKELKIALASELEPEEMKRLGLDTIQGMFVYAVEKVFINGDVFNEEEL